MLLFTGHVYEQKVFFHIAFHRFCGIYWSQIDYPIILYLSYSLFDYFSVYYFRISVKWCFLMNVILSSKYKLISGWSIFKVLLEIIQRKCLCNLYSVIAKKYLANDIQFSRLCSSFSRKNCFVLIARLWYLGSISPVPPWVLARKSVFLAIGSFLENCQICFENFSFYLF